MAIIDEYVTPLACMVFSAFGYLAGARHHIATSKRHERPLGVHAFILNVLLSTLVACASPPTVPALNGGSVTHSDVAGSGGRDAAFTMSNFPRRATCVTVAVHMFDSWGDGWQGSVLYIGDFTFTFFEGSKETSTVCLEPGVIYYPYACLGTYLSEVSWAVGPEGGSVSGGADESCTGAVPLALSACEAGNAENSSGACLPCVAGQYSTGILLGPCIPCPSGRFSSNSTMSSCRACSPGRYQESSGSIACDTCPARRPSSSAGASSSTSCHSQLTCVDLSSPRGGSVTWTPVGYTPVALEALPASFTLMETATGRYWTADVVEIVGATEAAALHFSASRPSGMYGPSALYLALCQTAQSDRCIRHHDFSLKLQPFVDFNFDFAWQFFLKNGTTDQVILYNPGYEGAWVWSSPVTPNGLFLSTYTTPHSDATIFTLRNENVFFECPAGKFAQCGKCVACPAGTFSAGGSATATICTNCTVGTYAISVGSVSCADCAAGYYCASPGLTSFLPFPCAAGKYAGAGASICTACATGRYQDASAGAMCKSCVAGKYSSVTRSTACANCSASTFSAAWASFCTTCPSGQFSEPGAKSCADTAPPTSAPTVAPTVGCVAGEVLSAGTCQKCPRGRFGNASLYSAPPWPTECSLCAPGKYTNATGSWECASCPTGTLSTTNRQKCSTCSAGEFAYKSLSCEPCGEGTYAPQGLSDACLLCPEGSITDSLKGSSTCKRCPAGAFGNRSISTVVCTLCSLGRFQPSTGETACMNCDPGKFASSRGSTQCTTCSAGTVSRFDESAACAPCSPGYFQMNPGQNDCLSCDAGTYAPVIGSTLCLSCESIYNSNPGSANCTLAAAGYFLDPANGWVSSRCPFGSVCDGGRYMPRPNEGYFVARHKIKFAGLVLSCLRDSCKGGGVMVSDCWLPKYFGSNNDDDGVCAEANLLCREGSRGPLCGACDSGFTFATATGRCIACETSWEHAGVVLGLCIVMVAAYTLVYTDTVNLPRLVERSWFVGTLRQIDSGAWRITWSTYQIVESVVWNINVNLPYPFSSLIDALSIFSLEFLSLSCLADESNHHTSVVIWSVLPIIIVAANIGLFKIRKWRAKSFGDVARLLRQHLQWYLLLTFVVVPPVSRKLFQALECITVADGKFLRIDTSISCTSAEFVRFERLASLFIAIYLGTPLIWLALLCRDRDRLNPSDPDRQRAMRERDADMDLEKLRFLYRCYKPEFYYFEVVEVYRRVFFVGALPLVCSEAGRRAALGILSSLVSAIVYRELEPFQNNMNNVLVHCSQYAILLTFGTALSLDSDLSKGVDQFILGVGLCFINLSVLGLAVAMGAWHHFKEDRKQWDWRRALSTSEFGILTEVFKKNMARSSSDDQLSSEKLLSQYLLKPSEILLEKKVGSGAFGDVFRGTCVGELCAIKTMINITPEAARDFRDEILLTAKLRHPNIVNFIGACWGRELTCLVLEWVAKGSLGDLLVKNASSLTWEDPLLKVACDVARGMAYLHGREWFDENIGAIQSCIVHRDLKPDNCLITEYTSAKIADFGASRAKGARDVIMTAVGTPLFCAPEVARGDLYDESIDVYSFGLTLLDIATSESIIDFISKKWAKAFKKKTVLKNPSRFIRSMQEENWRPVTEDDPLINTPPSVSALIMMCMAADPKARPSFSSILDMLSGQCKHTVIIPREKYIGRGLLNVNHLWNVNQNNRPECESEQSAGTAAYYISIHSIKIQMHGRITEVEQGLYLVVHEDVALKTAHLKREELNSDSKILIRLSGETDSSAVDLEMVSLSSAPIIHMDGSKTLDLKLVDETAEKISAQDVSAKAEALDHRTIRGLLRGSNSSLEAAMLEKKVQVALGASLNAGFHSHEHNLLDEVEAELNMCVKSEFRSRKSTTSDITGDARSSYERAASGPRKKRGSTYGAAATSKSRASIVKLGSLTTTESTDFPVSMVVGTEDGRFVHNPMCEAASERVESITKGTTNL